MDRQRVADVLEEIGRLLEILGENPFKTRAYDNAARIVRGLDRDLAELISRRELTGIKGIGPALADKIETLVAEGQLPYLESLRRQVPPGLLEWLKIPGLGAKKARAIHLTLGISTIDELEQACRDERLRELPGFGETSQRKILAAIARVRQQSGRFLHSLVQAEAARLLQLVRSVPGVSAAEAGGSVRRKLETSKDIDIVASATDPAAVMDAFAGAPGVAEVTGRGPTKCSVRLLSGPAADLRVVPEASFPFALQYFTGSKAHNIALRGRAQRRGLKLNEYALVREEDGGEIACADEAAIYRELGIAQWIPPELREDQGEIEAAEIGALPRLIERSDLEGIFHVHSTWSDGSATIAELAREALAMGLGYLAVCDHSKSAVYANGLDAERLHGQRAEIDRLNEQLGGKPRILHGIEVDILLDGSLDLADEELDGLDLVIASVHSRFDLDAERQTQRILRALAHPLVDVLGHATGRRLLTREGYALDLPQVLSAAAAHGVAVELNCHPQRLDLDWRSLRAALKAGVLTCIDPDAHSTGALHDVAFGVDCARKAWCTRNDVLNAWPLDELLAYLTERRGRSAAVDRGRGAD